VKWTVGLITAPRQNASYVDQTLRSLHLAGWNDVTAFAEPNTEICADHVGRIIRRPKVYGDWTNWATGFYELLLSNPTTDYFLMAEDDALICKDAKKYLEYALPQLGEFASLSLYTPSHYRRKKRCFHNELRSSLTWSTVTVIMSQKQAISFFSDNMVQRHRFENIFDVQAAFWCCPKSDPKNTIKDAVIGQWAERQNLPVYYHTPSLAEHVGLESTLTDEASNRNNGRQSCDFVGEDHDLSEWFKSPIDVQRHASINVM
jgi:hypothetical protein